MSTKILLKRGLEANIPALDEAELGYTTDTKKVFIGTSDGNKAIGSDFAPEIATKEEAETGTNNTKMMTPLRVKESINKHTLRYIELEWNYNLNESDNLYVKLPTVFQLLFEDRDKAGICVYSLRVEMDYTIKYTFSFNNGGFNISKQMYYLGAPVGPIEFVVTPLTLDTDFDNPPPIMFGSCPSLNNNNAFDTSTINDIETINSSSSFPYLKEGSQIYDTTTKTPKWFDGTSFKEASSGGNTNLKVNTVSYDFGGVYGLVEVTYLYKGDTDYGTSLVDLKHYITEEILYTNVPIACLYTFLDGGPHMKIVASPFDIDIDTSFTLLSINSSKFEVSSLVDYTPRLSISSYFNGSFREFWVSLSSAYFREGVTGMTSSNGLFFRAYHKSLSNTDNFYDPVLTEITLPTYKTDGSDEGKILKIVNGEAIWALP